MMINFYSRYLGLISLLYLCTMCTNDSDREYLGAGACVIDTTSIIQVNSPAITPVYGITQQLEPNQFIAYTPVIHSIDWVDLSNSNSPLNKRLQLLHEGPKGIDNVKDIYLHNSDTIFVACAYHLFIIDAEGAIIRRIPINQSSSPLKGIDFSNVTLYAHKKNGTGIHYYPKEKSLYIPCKASRYDQFTIPDHYEVPILAKWDVSNDSVTILDLEYPDKFREQSYGLLNRPNISYTEGKIVYNFKVDSDIYVYDLKTQKVITHKCQSQLADDAEPFLVRGTVSRDPEALVNHVRGNPDYGGVIFNPYRNEYYRSLLFPDDFSVGRNQLKKMSLMVLSPEFKVKKEIILPKGTVSFMTRVFTEQGVLLPMLNDDEDIKLYRHLKLTCT